MIQEREMTVAVRVVSRCLGGEGKVKEAVVQGLVGAGARGQHPASTCIMWDPWGLVQMSACSCPQAPLSMGFSRQEHWNGLLFPSLEDLPHPGIEPGSPALQSDSLPLSHQGSPRLGLSRLFLLSAQVRSRRRQWQPTPVFLPGESQGRGSLVGCRLWGHTESDMTEAA